MCGYFQVSWTDVGPVIRQLSGGSPECWEDVPSLDPDRENSREIGSRPASVRNALLGSGAGVVTLWGRYLGFVGSNFQEAIGVHVVFLRQVTSQKAKRHRDGTWRSAETARVLKEEVT